MILYQVYLIKLIPVLVRWEINYLVVKKRIGIARALYKNPELLPDEAANGLDKETENKILSMIFKFKEDKTLIIIS